MTLPAQTVVKNILERCVCMVLTCSQLGNQKKVSLKSARLYDDQEAEGSDLGAQKRPFAASDLTAPKMVIGALKQQMRSLSVDGGVRLFGAGTYMIPLLHVQAAEETIAKAQADLAERVDKLVADLPDIVERRRAKLGPLFALKDYPTAQEVRAAFRIRYHFVSFGAPEQLEEVSAAAYARAVATHNQLLAAAYQDVVTGLRESAALVMQELVNKLKPGADGKPKALQPTALKDLQELLDRLPVLNSVAEDTALAQALGRVAAVSQGLNVEALRQAPGMRAVLLAEAEAAAASLDHLVSTGLRAIDLSDL